MMMEQRCELLRQMGTKDIGAIAEESRHQSDQDKKYQAEFQSQQDNTMTWSPTHNNRNNILKEEVQSDRKLHRK